MNISTHLNPNITQINNNNNNNNNNNFTPTAIVASTNIPKTAYEIFYSLRPTTFVTKSVKTRKVVSRFTDISCPKHTALKYKNTYLHANRVHLSLDESKTPPALSLDPSKTPLASFIATQAPTAESAETFWGVAYNETNLIIDLTQKDELKDSDNNVETPYYPTVEKETKTFGNISITCQSIEKKSDHISVYRFEVTEKNNQPKTVYRIHYTNWVDGMGSDLGQLDKLIKEYESVPNESKKPAMVHCRAGVGRTGTFIVLNALKKLYEIKLPDEKPEELLKDLISLARKQRGNDTVQRTQQVEVLLKYTNNKIGLPEVSSEDPKRASFCKKYFVPFAAYDHPAFYSGEHDSDSIDEIAKSSDELLKIAREIEPNNKIYLLRPVSFQPTDNLEAFELVTFTPNGDRNRLRLGYLASCNEWVGLDLTGKDIKIVRDGYDATRISLDTFIKSLGTIYNKNPMIPLMGDLYNKVLERKRKRALEPLPSQNNNSQIKKRKIQHVTEKNSVTTKQTTPNQGLMEVENEEEEIFTPLNFVNATQGEKTVEPLPSQKSNSQINKNRFQVEIPQNTLTFTQPFHNKGFMEMVNQHNQISSPLNSVDATHNKAFTIVPNTFKEIFDTSMRLALNENNAVAQSNLGYYYATGFTKKKDFKTSFMWYKKAADNGDTHAQIKVGELYEAGLGTHVNMIEALKYYKQAASQVIPVAQFKFHLLRVKSKKILPKIDIMISLEELAYCYEKGYGTPKNLNEAFKYHQEAAELGNFNAQLKLAICYRFGIGTPVNLQEAQGWENRGLINQQLFLQSMSMMQTVRSQNFS